MTEQKELVRNTRALYKHIKQENAQTYFVAGFILIAGIVIFMSLVWMNVIHAPTIVHVPMNVLQQKGILNSSQVSTLIQQAESDSIITFNGMDNVSVIVINPSADLGEHIANQVFVVVSTIFMTSLIVFALSRSYSRKIKRLKKQIGITDMEAEELE